MSTVISNMKARKTGLILLVISVFLSIFLLRPALNSDKFKSYSMDYLDQKEQTVLKVTAASTAASVVLAAIPTDTTTPIAEKLADVSGYMAVVLSIVFFEKYLVPVTGTAASLFLIPAALILMIGYLLSDRRWLKNMGIRLLLLSAVIVCVVPLSVAFSKSVDATYQDKLDQSVAVIEDIQSSDDSSKKSSDRDTETTDDSDKNIWERISDTLSDAKDTVTDGVEKLSVSVQELVSEFKGVLNNFVEGVAVMILTSFIVPIVTFILLLWLVKIIFNAAAGNPAKDYEKMSRQLSGQLKSIENSLNK